MIVANPENVNPNPVVYRGAGIPIPKDRLESTEAIHKAVKTILHGVPISRDSLKPHLIKAVLVNNNEAVMQKFREEVQHEMDQLALPSSRNDKNIIVFKSFLSSLISILPFTYPKADQKFIIPTQQADGTWKRVEYTTEILTLTPETLSTPIKALCLTPCHEQQAPPLMIFQGTTYPGGEGFAATVMADFTPGHAVGEYVYSLGKEEIESWISNKQRVNVFGISLGGAMAYHILKHHHDKLESVNVINPPGLYAWNKEFDEGCEINIFTQPGDIVTKLGYYPQGRKVNLYCTHPLNKHEVKNVLSSHAQTFSGYEEIEVEKLDPKVENSKFLRKFLTFSHKYFGPLVVFLPFIALLILYRLSRFICDVAFLIFSSMANELSTNGFTLSPRSTTHRYSKI